MYLFPNLKREFNYLHQITFPFLKEEREMNIYQIPVLEKTLESPLDCKEIKPVNPKVNQS